MQDDDNELSTQCCHAPSRHTPRATDGRARTESRSANATRDANVWTQWPYEPGRTHDGHAARTGTKCTCALASAAATSAHVSPATTGAANDEPWNEQCHDAAEKRAASIPAAPTTTGNACPTARWYGHGLSKPHGKHEPTTSGSVKSWSDGTALCKSSPTSSDAAAAADAEPARRPATSSGHGPGPGSTTPCPATAAANAAATGYCNATRPISVKQS